MTSYENLKANVKVIREYGAPAELAVVLLAAHIAGGPDIPSETLNTAKSAVEDNLRCVETQYDGLINIYMGIE